MATTYTKACSTKRRYDTLTQAREAAGLSARSGTFATYLSRLRTLELIAGRGDLKASEEFFQ